MPTRPVKTSPARHALGITRRDLLRGAAAGLVLPLSIAHTARAQVPRRPRSAVRMVHLTDWHLMEGRGADRGLLAALEHALDQKPQVLLDGGDTMTHTMSRTLENVRPDMAYVERLFAAVPGRVERIHAIGNHDIWGWDAEKSGSVGDEPEYGKQWWVQRFGNGRRYGRTKVGRWHIINLDSVQPRGTGYYTALDDEQFAWLSDELPQIPASEPVLVLSHAPILCVATLLSDAGIDPQRGWSLGPGHMLMDAWRVVDLFSRFPNVKLALSGHKHICDRIEFQGMTHICGGAVCGRWWQPTQPRHDAKTGVIRPAFADRGYGLLDVFPDGRFDYRYVVYPWDFVS